MSIDAAALVAERDARVREAERRRACEIIAALRDHLFGDLAGDEIADAIGGALDAAASLIVTVDETGVGS